MADVVTFDPLTLRIIEIDAAGDNTLDVVEVYSEWKDWVKVGDNAKHPKAFRAVGGDPITDTESLGITYFLVNGWRIRPAESDHKLTLVGNIFTDPSGFSVFVVTLGAFTVNTETRVSDLNTVVGGDDLELLIQSGVGNVDVSSDDLTVTIRDENLVVSRQLSVSADGRIRRIL